jgi:hypothetical protein
MTEPTCAQALRAIGEDLESRDLKTFEIRKHQDRYVVRCGYQSPPAVTPLILEYTEEDIEELNLRGRESCSAAQQTLDFTTLSQTLRTIGGYLDQKKAALVRISNNDVPGTEPTFRIEYETPDGELLVDDRSTAALYDIGVYLYKRRRKLSGTTGMHDRWRC